MSEAETKTSFFRQSSWMMVATFAGGIFMFAVHIFGPFMSEKEYSVFTTLLQTLNLMMIPALGLQTMFAQQTAGAFDELARRKLAGTTRAVLNWMFMIWVAMTLLAVVYRQELMATLKIANPAALWMTVAFGLPQLWSPILLGIVQGKQRFLWLGWSVILNGVGRFVAVAIIVLVFGGLAAMTGAWLGMMCGFAVSAWHSRDVWLGASDGFQWREWLERIVPLTLGLGASQFMLAADMIVVQSLFNEQTGWYGAAGMIGRGLVVFTAPVAVVVFPKIVRSVARAQKLDVLGPALLATAVLGGLAALACTAVAWSFPAMLDFLAKTNSETWVGIRDKVLPYRLALEVIASLVPWFVWSMLPLALSNVLIYGLLARQRYQAVPWLVLVAAAYACALTVFHGSFFSVVRTLGVFTLLLMGTAMWFSWRGAEPAEREPSTIAIG